VDVVLRLLSGPNVDWVQVVRNDPLAEAMIGAVAPFFQPDAEYVVKGLPDREKVHVGLDGLRAGLLDWIAPWATYRIVVKDAVDRGDRVLLLVNNYGRLEKGSEEVQPSGASLCTVRDGKIARWEVYSDRAEAFNAVGLAE
jgi:ketosteroid isomerase-like protein